MVLLMDPLPMNGIPKIPKETREVQIEAYLYLLSRVSPPNVEKQTINGKA
jgi:hypothetical protein